MPLKPLVVALLIGAGALSGCKQDTHSVPVATSATPAQASEAVAPSSGAHAKEEVRLNLPALPIIRNAVFALTPTFEGKRDPQIMAQLCGLARGELTQEQVNTFLGQHSIDPGKLPKSGHPLSLLVNGDKAGQTTACAAYLATSVMIAPDTSEYLRSAVVEEKAPAINSKSKSADKAASKPATVTVQQVDNAALGRVLPVKLAVARANADLFALIASELQRQPGLPLGQYRSQAMQLFTRLAPVYLERIKVQMPNGVRFDVKRLDGGMLVFRGNDGSLFEFDGNNLRLMQNDILWFGEGKLLGQDYVLSVAYFDPSVGKLLAPAKP